MSTAAAPSRAVRNDVSEILAAAKKVSTNTSSKQEVKTEDARFANIQANPFFSIMFKTDASLEEKRALVTQQLVATGVKEQDRTSLKAFEIFKEYLQSVRQEMSKEIIKMTDTETFSELQATYNDLHNDLLTFNEKMKPLTDIIDAIYTLRTNGLTLDAFQEIKEDKVREAELNAQRDSLKNEFNSVQSRISSLNESIAVLNEDKSFFGFGGVSKSAREEIARKTLELDTARNDLETISNKVNDVANAALNETELGEFAAEKKQLRELLDITSDDHINRQKDLVAAALNFVNTSKTRIGSIRNHLGLLDNQMENLFDANGKMTETFAVMNEGIREAEKVNQEKHQTLTVVPENENLISKMTRDQTRVAVEEHITLLDTAAVDTATSYADLTSQSIRIKTMRDGNRAQIQKARDMHSQGIAGVADRISTTLQAVSTAALGESAAAAKDVLYQMNLGTNAIAQKEAIKVAMGISDQNQDLLRAIDDVGAFGDVVRAATDITRSGVEEMRKNLESLKTIAESVQEGIQESFAVNAEVGAGTVKSDGKKEESTGSNPFKL